MDQQNFIKLMPEEVLTNIFSYLPRRDRFICMCMCSEWREAMDTPVLWKHMSVRLDVDFFEVSTIQLTIEFCKYIKSLELRFEYPEEPMQWINYKMLDITKRTYRFLSIFVNKNLQITKLCFDNFCDFYRSKKILYYLSMFLRSQYKLKAISFNGSYFSKKTIIKILASSIAANKNSIEYLDIQNSYYENDYQLIPSQLTMLSSQLMLTLTTIDSLVVLKMDLESLISNKILNGFLTGNCDTLKLLDIRIAEHDISNISSSSVYNNSVWISMKKKFKDLKVSLTFYNIICAYEGIEKILARSLPIYCSIWTSDSFIMKDIYTLCLQKYANAIEIIKIHAMNDSIDDLIVTAIDTCLNLTQLEFSGFVNNIQLIQEITDKNSFNGFKAESKIVQSEKSSGVLLEEKVYKNVSVDRKMYTFQSY